MCFGEDDGSLLSSSYLLLLPLTHQEIASTLKQGVIETLNTMRAKPIDTTLLATVPYLHHRHPHSIAVIIIISFPSSP